MSVPVALAAFTHGEVSPSMFGRYDLPILHSACSTLRNSFVSFRGGSYSRAGTLFVGFSKQTGRSYPPRLIDFQFSINQGLALEFGNFYMRVISDGGFVTESPFAIEGITNANPAVVSLTAVASAQSATPNSGLVTASYAPGNTVTLAGGTFTTAAVLDVVDTSLVSVATNSPGTSGYYAPGDTVALVGGTQIRPAVIQVTETTVVSATIAFGGSGGSNGISNLTCTTGVGTAYEVSVTVSGGRVTSINSVVSAGLYTVNPTNPPAAIMNGPAFNFGGTSKPEFNLVLGIAAFSVASAGIFSTNPAGGNFTQASTSGQGVGATFQTAVMGPQSVSIGTPGAYTVIPGNPVSQGSTSGAGAGATFNVTWNEPGTLQNGDWVAIDGAQGMTQINGQTYVVSGATMSSIALNDVYGNAINSTAFGAWTSGGTVSRIYTLTSPYAEEDLPYLKFTQSADVMSLCCVNQITQDEYLPYDLARTTDTDWTFAPLQTNSTVLPPPTLSGTASTTGTVTYQYVVTAISPLDGSESIASEIATIANAVDIAATAGSITLIWTPSPTANVASYNIYKAEPGYGATPPVGSLFGFAGSALGTQFIDSKIVADSTEVPPTHQNPFARGVILGVTPVSEGSAYVAPTYAIGTNTGSGAVLEPVLISGAIPAWLELDPGQNYLPTDTLTISDASGSGATALLNVGPESGTYPAVPFYFQERRGYAYSLNDPDTYWMSQPGSFTNFDFRTPTIDSDAITGSPWATEVNGIQWALQVSAGLLVMTGLQAWLLVGTGSFATNVQPIAPSSQVANPQPSSGCSPLLPPIRINYDVIYVTAQGGLYYDLPYQLYALSEPIDLTQFSSHLFVGFTPVEHAWCEQPNKILWSVRDDGALLSLTWLKAQEVAGWGRHDTQGLYKSVCSVIEPPVNALYLATQRFPGNNTAYMIERMDNRIWPNVESTWCVDCGLTLTQPEPNATLTASSATGLGACSGVTGLVGGTLYSAATTAVVVDAPMTPNQALGPGSGAVPTLTIVGGVITGVTFAAGQQGAAYLNPKLVITDPANSGSGGDAKITLNNSMTFTASAAVFSNGNVGSVIRAGGGIASITAFVDAQHVTANILSPIVDVFNDGTGVAVPQSQPSGSWTMTAPVGTVFIPHLVGATVTGLADGNVIPPTVVGALGAVGLPVPASAVTVGLGFQAQLQSVYLDAGEPTVQGQRKKIAEVVLRVENSRGLKVGVSQPDGSTLSPMQVAPPWYTGPGGLTLVPDVGPNFPRKPYNALATQLLTGDVNVPSSGGFDMRAQIAVQQDNPLPMQILALVPSLLPGDPPQTQAPKRQGKG